MKQVSYLIVVVVYRDHRWLERVRVWTRRTIYFVDGSSQDIRVFSTCDRKWGNWFKVETTWTIGPHEHVDTYNARINSFFDKLNADI